MNKYIFSLSLLGLAACSSRPIRPIVGAGVTTESISGHFNFETARFIGVDLMLDAGSMAFFLDDSHGSIAILAARTKPDGLTFTLYQHENPKLILGLSERRAIADQIEQRISTSNSRRATVELAALLRTGGELQPIRHWKQIW